MAIRKIINQIEESSSSGSAQITNISTTEINVLGGLAFSEGANIPSATNINNFNLDNESFFKITGSTSSSITGFANGSSGRFIIIVNNTSANQTFVQENANSSAPNRFVLGQANRTIGVNSTATFIYVTGLTIGGVSAQSRWVLVALT
jgi:hypothetical protein